MRIVDLSRVLAGPWATMHLADQGFDVIKVEPPNGDDTRAFGPHVQGVSTYYLSANRNKRSIVLDLKTAEDRSVLHELVRTADVVLHNYRPGVAERLGCDHDTLKALRPGLVYVAIHAFGAEGEHAHKPGYDLVLQALGGAMSITGQPGQGPVKCGTSIADLMTGMFTVQAILQGLLHREQTGEGQAIVVSMMTSQAHALAYHATRWFAAGTEDVQRGNSHGGLAPYDVYACTDGWLAVGCGNDAIFGRLSTLLALPERPAWSSNPGRVADRTALDAVIRERLASWSLAEAERRFAEAGVPAAPVLTPAQTLSHSAVPTVRVQHPVLGSLSMVGPALDTLDTRAVHTAPPLLDADGAALRAEIS